MDECKNVTTQFIELVFVLILINLQTAVPVFDLLRLHFKAIFLRFFIAFLIPRLVLLDDLCVGIQVGVVDLKTSFC